MSLFVNNKFIFFALILNSEEHLPFGVLFFSLDSFDYVSAFLWDLLLINLHTS